MKNLNMSFTEQFHRYVIVTSCFVMYLLAAQGIASLWFIHDMAKSVLGQIIIGLMTALFHCTIGIFFIDTAATVGFPNLKKGFIKNRTVIKFFTSVIVVCFFMAVSFCSTLIAFTSWDFLRNVLKAEKIYNSAYAAISIAAVPYLTIVFSGMMIQISKSKGYSITPLDQEILTKEAKISKLKKLLCLESEEKEVMEKRVLQQEVSILTHDEKKQIMNGKNAYISSATNIIK